jgi:hypothetical protein
MDRIINMILNRLLRRVINRGVDAGVNAAFGNRDDDQMTPDQRQSGQRATQGVRQMTRMASRFTRL